MDSDVALVIIYNHQYNKNIEILESLYQHRFRYIFHLVPFYQGERENVIPVYENSFYFQGYLAQGLKSFFHTRFVHYFFIADDLLLHPEVNEQNYREIFHLEKETCFLPGFMPDPYEASMNLHDSKSFWNRIAEAYHWQLDQWGIEVADQLPDKETALKKFNHFHLSFEPLRFRQLWKTPSSAREWIGFFRRKPMVLLRYVESILTNRKFLLPYPLAGSYSDICIVSHVSIKEFCHYCGVFAATRLFVEVGLPTAMVLAAEELRTENDLESKGLTLWTKQDFQLLERFGNSLSRLMDDFPDNCLYIHPVKLSQWT